MSYLDDLHRLCLEREKFLREYETEERRLVRTARGHGCTWEQIAKALGRTRSAVWQKHHTPT